MDYVANPRPKSERNLPDPELFLPRWNFEHLRRTGEETEALVALSDHRRRHRKWQGWKPSPGRRLPISIGRRHQDGPDAPWHVHRPDPRPSGRYLYRSRPPGIHRVDGTLACRGTASSSTRPDETVCLLVALAIGAARRAVRTATPRSTPLRPTCVPGARAGTPLVVRRSSSYRWFRIRQPSRPLPRRAKNEAQHRPPSVRSLPRPTCRPWRSWRGLRRDAAPQTHHRPNRRDTRCV